MSPIPSAFTARKDAITSALAMPKEEYQDLSPKGSIDEAIIPLILQLNSYPGVVTTSSCAGRISVFLEGSKDPHDGLIYEQNAVPGGKGNGGRWLYVSHEPVNIPPQMEPNHLTELFHLLRDQSKTLASLEPSAITELRFVKFQFEPMILHIMCASLTHARPILAAAINAGFRESGVQSLKNLDDSHAFPMVAVRTNGLALSSLIGFVAPEVSQAVAMTEESYLYVLLLQANERFKANEERIKRFQIGLRVGNTEPWEEKDQRRERKRAAGLAEQAKIRDREAEDVAKGRSDASQ